MKEDESTKDIEKFNSFLTNSMFYSRLSSFDKDYEDFLVSIFDLIFQTAFSSEGSQEFKRNKCIHILKYNDSRIRNALINRTNYVMRILEFPKNIQDKKSLHIYYSLLSSLIFDHNGDIHAQFVSREFFSGLIHSTSNDDVFEFIQYLLNSSSVSVSYVLDSLHFSRILVETLLQETTIGFNNLKLYQQMLLGMLNRVAAYDLEKNNFVASIINLSISSCYPDHASFVLFLYVKSKDIKSISSWNSINQTIVSRIPDFISFIIRTETFSYKCEMFSCIICAHISSKKSVLQEEIGVFQHLFDLFSKYPSHSNLHLTVFKFFLALHSVGYFQNNPEYICTRIISLYKQKGVITNATFWCMIREMSFMLPQKYTETIPEWDTIILPDNQKYISIIKPKEHVISSKKSYHYFRYIFSFIVLLISIAIYLYKRKYDQ